MATMTLQDIASRMKKLDIAMFTTQTKQGLFVSRPMSNNGEVEYDGNSYYFTEEKSRIVSDIEEKDQVNLSFTGSKELYISIAGEAKLIRDKQKMKDHWAKDLELYFENGIDTPGIVMIHVKGLRIKYWQGEKEGEVKI